MDGNEDDKIWSLDKGDSKYFDFKIANPTDCYAFSIVIR